MLKILILEDDPIDLELIETTLRNGGVDGELGHAGNRKEFLEKLKVDTPDLILADFVLPKFDGAVALEMAKSACPQVPFILVSGVLGEEQAIESLKQGATDYVLKQRLGRLVPSVKRALRETEERHERQKVAKALRETDDLLRAIVDASPVSIITVNYNYEVITWNTAAEDLYGYEAGSIVGRRIPVVPEAEWEDFEHCFARVLQNETIANKESKHLTRGGNLIDVSMSLAPLHDADEDHVYGIVMTVADITLRKQIETHRLDLLQQESEARAAAEDANRIKDEFLAVLSHELRTPLNAIVGWIQLIQKGKLKSEAFQRALNIIERNAAAQTQLIEDLLDLSRIVRGQVNLAIQPVDVSALIHATVEALKPAAQAKSIRVKLEISVDVPTVLADPNRLQQICWNLLSNAIKFTPNDGQVTVRLLTDEQLSIQVIDSGIGIAPEFLPHVFEHFRQADGSSKRSQGGLGLGLAITCRLVELHGGTITARSAGLGEGATFTVNLPIRSLQHSNGQSPNVSSNGITLTGIKVIVVDDEADARELLEVILEQSGARVKAVSSAEAARQLLKEFQPNIIISDIGMPDEDGYRFLQMVRNSSDSWLREVPAIALTAYAGAEDRQRALDNSYAVHIAKPFDPDEVISAVYELTNN